MLSERSERWLIIIRGNGRYIIPTAGPWAKDRTDPHAREEALRIACEEPLAGRSSDEAVAAVREVLDSVGDTCPECE